MSNKQPISTFLGIAAAVVLATNSHAADINVPGDQATIQAGINIANPGDVVIVAQGEYFENINFNGKAITVRSTDPTDPRVVANTIINGGGSGTVVTCVSGEGSDTVLSGFVITGGTGHDLGDGLLVGGGMWIEGSSPTVTNCSFSGNSAALGGGMFNNGSNPTVTNCTFSGNSATNQGGGMANGFESNPTVTNCTFIGNTANVVGGGMRNFASDPTVTNCTFSGNTANNPVGATGGGMYNSNASIVTVTNTGFCDNTPNHIDGGPITDGGGNCFWDSCVDINIDGVVNVLDLIDLLLCFGQPAIPGCEAEDINFDGTVNVLDLVALLLSFGDACP